MKGKDIAIVGGILIAGGLFSALVATNRIREIINKGEIVIDTTGNMPDLISNLLKHYRVFPKRIPIKMLIESVKNKKKQSEIDEILKWFSLRIIEKGRK